MKIKTTLQFVLILLYSSVAHGGCPAMGIESGNMQVLNCHFNSETPSGALLEANLNYENEMHMGERSAKDLKAKIFFYANDNDTCKKFEDKNKTYCVSLQQWCVMTGPAPRGARFTLSNFKEKNCATKPAQP